MHVWQMQCPLHLHNSCKSVGCLPLSALSSILSLHGYSSLLPWRAPSVNLVGGGLVAHYLVEAVVWVVVYVNVFSIQGYEAFLLL